jgi:hypothetical protein
MAAKHTRTGGDTHCRASTQYRAWLGRCGSIHFDTRSTDLNPYFAMIKIPAWPRRKRSQAIIDRNRWQSKVDGPIFLTHLSTIRNQTYILLFKL